MPLTIEAKEVEQTQQREREAPYRMGLAWPAVGWLPEELERLRRPDPTAVKYPLQEER